MSRVLIAEDHPLFVMAIQQVLETRHHVVGVVEDGVDVARAAEQLRATLVLLDLSMPNLSGVKLVRAVRAALPSGKILVVNGASSPGLVASCFEGGADGFIDKTVLPEEFLGAVRDVIAGRQPVAVDRAGQRVSERHLPREPLLSRLSPRLRQVLRLLGQGCTAAEIARRLGITKRTANAHRAALKARLGVRTPADLFRFALAYAETEEHSG
jgi:DNA-binding NarL/FixJ family response regulator